MESLFICTFVNPFQTRTSQTTLKDSRTNLEAKLASQQALRPAWLVFEPLIGFGMEKQIYRSVCQISKIGNMIIEPVSNRHHMVSGTLAPLYIVLGLKLDCSEATAPIEDKVL